jgi:integrase/recombinase XerD
MYTKTKTSVKSKEFNTLTTGFERELLKENKSEVHITEHTNYLNEFFSYVEMDGITQIKAIDQNVIDNYTLYLDEKRLNKRAGGLLCNRTVNKHINTIRKFWKYLQVEGVKANSIHFRKRKNGERKEPTVLTQQEIQQLYSVCDDSAIGYRDRAMLAIYYGCGMRKSEGLRLLVTDIDFGKGRIHIRKTKTNRERYVMMSPVVQKQIEDYVYTARDFYLREDSSYLELFIGERSSPVCGEALSFRIELLWSRVNDRYGSLKHIGLHTLRHSLGTHLYMAKMDIDMIALMLGHRSLEATQLYIHSANQLNP